MGAFGSFSLGIKFGLVLGCAIVVTFIAGFIKLYFKNRTLKKNTKIADEEAKLKKTDKEKLVNERELDEGDLFGVRALERGYFGGVSQSRPSSQANSLVLSPSTTVTDWTKAGKPGPGSSASSIVEYPRNKNDSVVSLAVPENAAKRKPSPLKLQPSDAELDRMNNGATSPRSVGSVSPSMEGAKKEDWVNPMDVIHNKPGTPTSRPPSYLPRLNFPKEMKGDLKDRGLLVVSPTRANSESASIVSAASPSTSKTASPTGFTFFPPEPPAMPSRAARGSSRSIFPAGESQERSPPSRDQKQIQTPSVPLANLPPQFANADPTNFPKDTREWSPSSPVIRESVVSKKHVSVYQPQRQTEAPHQIDEADEESAHTRNHSIAASSMYSTRTSILDYSKSTRSTHHAHQSQNSQPTRGRDRSTSSSRTHRSSRSLARTKDSIRRHSKTVSQESLRTAHRRSRDRDQLHFDPRELSHTRSQSGSIKGRSIDFDQPRESPFSNSNSTSRRKSSTSSSLDHQKHSANSSLDSADGYETRGREKGSEQHDPMPSPKFPPPSLQVEAPEQDNSRLSVRPFRSGSDASQVSIGDFYDAYYRQSILAQRASQMGGPRASALIGTNGQLGAGQGSSRKSMGLRVGLGLGAMGGITEVPSPNPSLQGNKETERFPAMI